MIPDPLAMIPLPPRSREACRAAAAPRLRGPLAWAWRDARDEAAQAYAAWCGSPGRDIYAAYVAAQDRADAAQDALARAAVLGNRRRREPRRGSDIN
jgi:hypothetical protein